jgi:hypothetical protein
MWLVYSSSFTCLAFGGVVYLWAKKNGILVMCISQKEINMTIYLPKDVYGHPVPAIRLRDGKAHMIEAGSTSESNQVAFDQETQIISIYANVPVFIRFGVSNTIEATDEDHYFPAGIYYDFAIGGDDVAHMSYCAILAADAAGNVYISEKA